MKLKNNIVFIFSLALVFVLGSSMLLNGAKFSKYDDFRMHQLKKKAAEKGNPLAQSNLGLSPVLALVHQVESGMQVFLNLLDLQVKYLPEHINIRQIVTGH